MAPERPIACVVDATRRQLQARSEHPVNKWKRVTILGIGMLMTLSCERQSQRTAVQHERGTGKKASEIATTKPLFLNQQGAAFRSLSIYEDFQGHGRTVKANYETKLDIFHDLPALAAEAQRCFSEGVQQEADRVGARYALISPIKSDASGAPTETAFVFERDAAGKWSKVVVPGKLTQGAHSGSEGHSCPRTVSETRALRVLRGNLSVSVAGRNGGREDGSDGESVRSDSL